MAWQVAGQGQPSRLLVDREQILGLAVGHRRGTGEDRRRRDSARMTSAQGEDVRCRAARPVHRHLLDSEVVEDCDDVVGRLIEAATGHPGRRSEAGPFGRDHH
jgi:hypothetical protein